MVSEIQLSVASCPSALAVSTPLHYGPMHGKLTYTQEKREEDGGTWSAQQSVWDGGWVEQSRRVRKSRNRMDKELSEGKTGSCPRL